MKYAQSLGVNLLWDWKPQLNVLTDNGPVGCVEIELEQSKFDARHLVAYIDENREMHPVWYAHKKLAPDQAYAMHNMRRCRCGTDMWNGETGSWVIEEPCTEKGFDGTTTIYRLCDECIVGGTMNKNNKVSAAWHIVINELFGDVLALYSAEIKE
jgi:hypothetical protein